ncbi:MAG: hypothetical protein ABR915_02550 [Thermoguttaceae bacterium]
MTSPTVTPRDRVHEALAFRRPDRDGGRLATIVTESKISSRTRAIV